MPSEGTKQGKRTRPKHVPKRMCVVCRESGEKRTLTRVVRTSESTYEADPTGRLNGRGAYVCEKASCWDKVLATPILARALRAEPDNESKERLTEFAAGLHLERDSQDSSVGSKE